MREELFSRADLKHAAFFLCKLCTIAYSKKIELSSLVIFYSSSRYKGLHLFLQVLYYLLQLQKENQIIVVQSKLPHTVICYLITAEKLQISTQALHY